MRSPARPSSGGSRLALRVGITGHRTSRLVTLYGSNTAHAKLAALRSAIDDVLATIAAGCSACGDKGGDVFRREPPLVSVVVGGALGADRIAASVVRAKRDAQTDDVQWRLETVLAGSLTLLAEAAWPDYVAGGSSGFDSDDRETYADEWRDFLAGCDAVTELPASWRLAADNSSRPKISGLESMAPFRPVDRMGPGYRLSYVEAANLQLRQIDLLVAIWDGKPSRGPGGVADIVHRAHLGRIPVVVIQAGNPVAPPAMLRGLEFGAAQPNVAGWAPQPIKPIVELADCRNGALADAIDRILGSPDRSEHPGRGDGVLSLADFLAERTRTVRWQAYDWLIALFGGGVPRRRRQHPADDLGRSILGWRTWAQTVGEASLLGRDIVEILHHHYVIASRFANAYAARYRSAFVLAFLGAAMASAFALVGETFLGRRPHLHAAYIAAEILLLLLIMAVILRGRRRRYHSKYLEYRSLAEALHNLRFLVPFAEQPTPLPTGMPRRWFDWYAETVVRSLALPNDVLDATYQRRVLDAVIRCEIDPQIAYHEANAQTMATVDRNVRVFGRVLFLGALATLLTLLVLLLTAADTGKETDGLLIPGLGLLAALLPSIGSAMAAIRSMADFEGRALRSTQMVSELGNLRIRAQSAMDEQDLAETRQILRSLAAIFSEDVETFRATFSRSELVVPS